MYKISMAAWPVTLFMVANGCQQKHPWVSLFIFVNGCIALIELALSFFTKEQS